MLRGFFVFVLAFLAFCAQAQELQPASGSNAFEQYDNMTVTTRKGIVYRYYTTFEGVNLYTLDLSTNKTSNGTHVKYRYTQPFAGDEYLYEFRPVFNKKENLLNFNLVARSYDDLSKEVSTTPIGSIWADKNDAIVYSGYSPDSSLFYVYALTYNEVNVYNHSLFVFNKGGELLRKQVIKAKFKLPYYRVASTAISNKGQFVVAYVSENNRTATEATQRNYEVNFFDEDKEVYQRIYEVEAGPGIGFCKTGLKFLKNGNLLVSFLQRFTDFNGLKFDDTNFSFKEGAKDVSFIKADCISMKKFESVWGTETGKIFPLDYELWNAEGGLIEGFQTPYLDNVDIMANGDICFSGDVYNSYLSIGNYRCNGIYHLFVTEKGEMLNTWLTSRPINKADYRGVFNYHTFVYGNDLYTIYNYPLPLLNLAKPSKVLKGLKHFALMVHKIDADGNSVVTNLTNDVPAGCYVKNIVPIDENKVLLGTVTFKVINGHPRMLTLPKTDLSAIKGRFSTTSVKREEPVVVSEPVKKESTNPRGRKVKR